MRWVILAVAGLLFLSVLPYARAQQAGDEGLRTNLRGVTTAPAPPEGFDPVTASDDELATYGFPPRPDEYDSPSAYHAWAKAMKASPERLAPALALTNHFNGPVAGPGKTANGEIASSNWSGFAYTTSTKSYGSTSINSVAMEYVVPVASQASGKCTGGWDYSSSWAGIDGFNNDDVLQAGTESDVACVSGTRTTHYDAWYEWFPNYEVVITNLAVSPGDDMYVHVWSTSATSGHAYLVNYNTNKSVTIAFSAPSGTRLAGSSAEWVVERPMVGSLTTLTNYISDYFSDASAKTVGGTYYYPGSSGATSVTMVDDNGDDISTPTLLGSTAIWFQDAGSAR
jgi:hypothetical protein